MFVEAQELTNSIEMVRAALLDIKAFPGFIDSRKNQDFHPIESSDSILAAESLILRL
jgi:hypothetical protein